MFVFLRTLIYFMELKCLNPRFLIYLAIITNFLCILRCQFCLQYTTNQRFCKTWHSLNIKFTLIMKFNLENQIFSYVAGFVKNVFIQQIRAHLKKKIWRTSILLWLGWESVQNVARTRKWGTSHSTPRTLNWAKLFKCFEVIMYNQVSWWFKTTGSDHSVCSNVLLSTFNFDEVY